MSGNEARMDLERIDVSRRRFVVTGASIAGGFVLGLPGPPATDQGGGRTPECPGIELQYQAGLRGLRFPSCRDFIR